MNILKIILLYLLFADTYSYGMEHVALAQPDAAISQQKSRVSSLKNLILSKIGDLLIKRDPRVSIQALASVYPHAQEDCACVLAEDQRIALWKKYGEERKVLELDHCQLLAPDLEAEVKDNNVYAATFTADDKFLITLSCKRVQEFQYNYMLNVWRVSDWKARLDSLEKKALQNGEEDENGEQLAATKPCTEFLLCPWNGFIEHMYKLTCDATSSRIILTLPYGNCYGLSISSEGTIARLWRLNILPLAKELQAKEGTPEEEQLNQARSRIYVKTLAFNEAGNKILMLIVKNPDNETEVNKRGGTLYCFPIETKSTFLLPAPVINVLDETYKIADEVDAAMWRQNDAVSFIETDHYNILRTVNTNGEEIDKKVLLFENIKDVVLQVDRLELRKNSDEVFIFSEYRKRNEVARIDKFDLNTGACFRLHDTISPDEEVLWVSKYCSRNAQLKFLNDSKFALKIFKDGKNQLNIILWNREENSCFTIATFELSPGYHDTVLALSANRSYLYCADVPFSFELSKLSALFILETPRASTINLQELIALTSK